MFLNAFPDSADQEVVEECVHDICKEEVSKVEIIRGLANSPQMFRKFGDKLKFVSLKASRPVLVAISLMDTL